MLQVRVRCFCRQYEEPSISDSRPQRREHSAQPPTIRPASRASRCVRDIAVNQTTRATRIGVYAGALATTWNLTLIVMPVASNGLAFRPNLGSRTSTHSNLGRRSEKGWRLNSQSCSREPCRWDPGRSLRLECPPTVSNLIRSW